MFTKFKTRPEATGYVSDIVGDMFSIGSFAILCERVISPAIGGGYIINGNEQYIKDVAAITNAEVQGRWDARNIA